ncbi:PAS/PAC sensor signal transduction histidine kinase [Desulfurobacterium thermolithotrophum DSM 11699]|uniref:histidine kinase n=1 Tax=Desulfurobacterium thermolithotrophum (strain DSM 11699 / BSA) TaxID=868864 RepID=F0S066_DESTD|nr:ATP-binding protein [Desulfurobacterium thermolithotrophum]ADY73745.1 PAS/PAC sensor signal transduction histidine kinase [Desulfurobacterium thermolithotrophum DSM 11699]
MEAILFAVTIFFATLTLLFAYIAYTERRKRERVLITLRLNRTKEEVNRRIDSTKLLARALSLLREGIVIMDPYGRVIYTNKFARELLDISPEDTEKFFYQAIKNFDVVSMINESFNEKYRIWQEKKIKDRYVQIIFGSDMDEKVLLLIDLTPMKKYENLKKDFIANVSHELKTPVATMKLLLETLEEECKDKPQAEKFLRKAIERVNYMEQLIEDLITLSMLESVNFPVKITTVKLKPFIEKIVHDLSEFAEKRKITVKVEIPDNISIKIDEKMFHAIMKNLIDNAIKYNKEGGSVEIAFKEYTNEIEISVCDTGQGIPCSHIPFIFERFYRVERSRSRKLGGTGLGLSIVKLATERLKGKVELESEEGKGTCFRIYLPKC